MEKEKRKGWFSRLLSVNKESGCFVLAVSSEKNKNNDQSGVAMGEKERKIDRW